LADWVPANRDLCCRRSIEADLAERNMRHRLLGALELMQARPGGYSLEAGMFHLPLGFGVKGSRVAVEVPLTVARILQLWDGEEEGGDVEADRERDLPDHLCYEFKDDKRLAVELHAIFDTLSSLAQRSVASGVSTPEWMRQRVYGSEEPVAPTSPGL
jgi:hypothetical protein